jgi:hypothetical protein
MVKCEIEILGPSMGPSGVQVRSAQHRPITFQLRRIVRCCSHEKQTRYAVVILSNCLATK